MTLLYALESIRTPLLDTFFSFVTHFGEETLFILAGLLFFWCVDKKEGYFLLCVGLLGTVINQFLKLFFRIPRPWVRDPKFTIVESARAEATGYSFPSGHTQVSVSTYGGIALWHWKSALSWVCLALCVLVPLSRMYLGVHTPADVGVSIAVALALIFLIYPLIRRGCGSAKTMRLLFGFIALLAIGNVLFVNLYPFPADVDADNLAHGVKNAFTMLGCVLGLMVTYEVDSRFTRFETKGSLRVQAAKLIPGLILLMAIKSCVKAPLYALTGGSYVADLIRYFLVVVFAGCLWPLTFPWIRRKFGE